MIFFFFPPGRQSLVRPGEWIATTERYDRLNLEGDSPGEKLNLSFRTLYRNCCSLNATFWARSLHVTPPFGSTHVFPNRSISSSEVLVTLWSFLVSFKAGWRWSRVILSCQDTRYGESIIIRADVLWSRKSHGKVVGK